MGKALNLDADHPSTKYWHSLHGDLVSAAHFRGMSVNEGRAARALRDLTPLLDMLVGPYFEVEEELSVVLGRANPTDADFAVVVNALGNRQLRWHCFKNFSGASWLRGLEERGCFGSPPRSRRYENGSWSPDAWVEGEFLLRVAAEAPDVVASILARIPQDNDNPAVWDVVAKCMMAMPLQISISLHKQLALSIARVPHVIWPEPFVNVVELFASDGQIAAALRIAKGLCALAPAPRTQSSLSAFGLSRPAVFSRIAMHDVPEIIEPIARAIVGCDAKAALTWLADLLRAAIRLSSVPENADEAQPAPINAHGQEEYSFWCERLDRDDRDTDSRVILARALASAAVTLGKEGEAGAVWALAELEAESHEIFRRIWRFVLARVSPNALVELNKWIASDDALVHDFQAREAGDVLRLRFAEATIDVQRAFVERLRAGPSIDNLQARVERAREWNEVTTIDAEREAWRLWQFRRFDARLPEAVAALANEFGFVPKARSVEQEDLDEDGHHSSGAGWVGVRSPVERSQLEAMTDHEIAALLCDWRPRESDHDGPSLRGLDETVSGLVSRNPSRGLAIGVALKDQSPSAHAIGAVANGLRDAASEEHAGSITEVLDWLDWAGRTLRELSPAAGARSGGRHGVQEPTRQCIDALRAWIPFANSTDAIGGVWRIVDASIDWPVLWEASHAVSETSTDSLSMNSINSLQGLIAHAVIDTARRSYNASLPVGREPSDSEVAAAIAGTASQLRPRLDRLLAAGSTDAAMLATLGQSLATLQFFVEDWVASSRPRLLAFRPDGSPVSAFWAAYLLLGRISPATFTAFRQEYAESLAGIAALPSSGRWSVPQHFAEHLLVAALWGMASLSDSDGLLQSAWASLRIDDISHAYWAVFRGWSDSEDAPPADVRGRLVDFWSWRLGEIESPRADTDRAREEANALSWWCVTPFLDDDAVLALGARTFRLSDAKNSAGLSLWERLSAISDSKVDAMWPIVRAAIDAQLRGPYPALFAGDVGPVLVKLSTHGTEETAARVREAIHDLGGRGFLEFREVLRSTAAPAKRDENR